MERDSNLNAGVEEQPAALDSQEIEIKPVPKEVLDEQMALASLAALAHPGEDLMLGW